MENDLMATTFWWLKVMGLELRNPRRVEQLFSRLLDLCLIYTSVLVLMAWQSDFDTIVQLLDVLLPFTEAIIKRLLLVVKRKDFRKILAILSRLEESHDIVQNPRTRTFYTIGKYSLVVLRITYVSGVFLMIFKSLYGDRKEMPYIVWLPADWNDSEALTIGQWVYFCVQAAIGLVLILSVAVVDSLYLAIAIHMVAHIELINHDFMEMFGNVAPGKKGYNNNKMVSIVRQQNLTFSGLDLVNSVFSFQMLMQLITIVVTICMGLVIINNSDSLFTMTISIQLFMVSSSTLQAFVYCFFGDYISEKLNNTTFMIYSSDWYLHPEAGNDMIILMQRANRIKPFTFGGLLNLDLETFTLIMKNSFSVYALLNAQKPELA